MARRRVTPHYIINLGCSLVALSLFAVTGVRITHNSSAATASPYGSADYCALENNQTVIYGWAADPDSTSLAQPSVMLNVGSATVSLQTNRANYRDNAVAQWIDTNRTGDPKPGTYGFRAAIAGLTKGNRYPISGTILNEGPGSNVILPVNNSSPTDGDTKKPFFADNIIPDACLANPAQPSPTSPAAATNLPAPKTASSDITGSSVSAGTMAAEIHVNTVGTTTVSVLYGANPLKLDQSTPDTPVTAPQTTITLTGLTAASSYGYRVVRTDASGKKTTSPLSNFDTLGYVVALHFVDNRDDGIQGIPVQLSPTDKPKISDDSGTVQLLNVSGGDHTLSYSYLGKDYTKAFTASAASVSPAVATAPQVITLDFTMNIQSLITARQPVKKSSSTATVVALIGGLLIALLLAVGLWLFHFWRSKRDIEAELDAPPPPLPEYKPLSPQLPPVVPGQPGADHMGESLKDLVLKDFKKPRDPTDL